MGKKLDQAFFERTNVVAIAKDLIGKKLVTLMDNVQTAGLITETEAYNGIVDRASHAYGGKRSQRTEIMYGPPGVAYVYLCYGIHSLFNVVTNNKDIPHAVLIRAIFPLEGLEHIKERRKVKLPEKKICGGPGTVSQGLGIHFSHSGIELTGNKIWIEDLGIKVKPSELIVRPRVGVDYAGEDALLPYRFILKSEITDKILLDLSIAMKNK
jgi:DNA-3-methyladenine glycosylase